MRMSVKAVADDTLGWVSVHTNRIHRACTGYGLGRPSEPESIA